MQANGGIQFRIVPRLVGAELNKITRFVVFREQLPKSPRKFNMTTVRHAGHHP